MSGSEPYASPHISNEVAIEIARLGLMGDASETGTLSRLTEVAARTVPGCVGATAVRWTDGRDPVPGERVGSHPDLAGLEDQQCARGVGPIFDAVRTGEAVYCNDTLAETRWPAYTATAMRHGVRCLAVTAHRDGPVLITITLYGALPSTLDRIQLGLATLLAAQGGAAVSNTSRYEDVHRTAVQLQEAVEARAIVDQAKGILMHAMGCDAETAFAELRRISQTRHVKMTALAQRIVAGHDLSETSARRGSPGRLGSTGRRDVPGQHDVPGQIGVAGRHDVPGPRDVQGPRRRG